MQKAIIFFIFSILFLSTSCSKAISSKEVTRAENFSFIFSDTLCGSTPVDVFNSRTSTLTHISLGETKQIIISLQLTNDELDAIFQKAIETDFFFLPSKLTPPTNLNQIYLAPSET